DITMAARGRCDGPDTDAPGRAARRGGLAERGGRRRDRLPPPGGVKARRRLDRGPPSGRRTAERALAGSGARMGQMRYIIIGAGAVGGTIGGSLFQGGHDVVLMARGAHLDALRARGLRLATPFGTHQLDIPAVGGPAELRLQGDDVLILASKTQDAAALLTEWAWQPVPGAPADAGSASASTAPAG